MTGREVAAASHAECVEILVRASLELAQAMSSRHTHWLGVGPATLYQNCSHNSSNFTRKAVVLYSRCPRWCPKSMRLALLLACSCNTCGPCTHSDEVTQKPSAPPAPCFAMS
jgi:hypothetical protein